MINETALMAAAVLAALATILGAFGAHAFKKILPEDKLSSFEVGVRYQWYHALALLVVGYQADFTLQSVRLACYFMLIGVLLFSVSIYLLAFANYWKANLKFLGPITPLGGLLMIMGWVSLLVSFI
ncbi:DUF423 domain-containing protein [Sphingobacterium sp. MYb382]|uniref:DUF423 domain-containing protein n=1 Tax=Sphingobacterium sp. MYb382 TaxID=2745278 RepID=UPI0030A49855